MNSYLNIQIRVIGAQAQAQLKAVQSQLNSMQSQLASAGVASASSFGSSTDSLRKWGSQVQWAGRQLTTSFTLPLAYAGYQAVKFADANDAAFVRIQKVYGDAGVAAGTYTAELNTLRKGFVALSEIYGITESDTLNIAADWAAAGAQGIALAKATDLTMKTMVLGEMSAVDATQALIEIQAQWGESTDQLTDTINMLNMVENQTGVSLQGLVQGFQVASGVARTAGLSTNQLAADIAAISPAAGSATAAGNALKTIISRLLAPTEDAKDVLGAMGINVADLAWKSADAQTRLEILAKTNSTLSTSQQAVVSSLIASRFQVNRYEVLMKALAGSLDSAGKSQSYYDKALNSSSDATANAKQANQELNMVLGTNIMTFARSKVVLQNALADAIQPMIPVLIQLSVMLAQAARWFSSLDPSVRGVAIALLGILAVVGPIVHYLGSFATLAAFLGKSIVFLLGPLLRMFGLFKSSAASVQTAQLELLQGTIDQVTASTNILAGSLERSEAVNAVYMASNDAVVTSLEAITINTRIVAEFILLLMARMAQYDASTGLMVASNIRVAESFAVIDGAAATTLALEGRVAAGGAAASATAGGAFSKLGGLIGKVGKFAFNPWVLAIAGTLILAYTFRDKLAGIWNQIVTYALKAFYSLPAGVQNAMIAVVRAVRDAALAVYGWFSYINPFAHHSPSLVENVANGVAAIKASFAQLAVASPIIAAVAAQVKAVNQAAQEANIAKNAPQNLGMWRDLLTQVNALTPALNAASVAVDSQQSVVDGLSNSLDAANKQLSDAKDNLQALQDVKPTGYYAMQDAIFANDQAQKKLQLQILQTEDAYGGYDNAVKSVQALSGEIEKLRGQQAVLRNAGAGSDILGVYDSQISGLQGQQSNISTTVNQVNALQNELDVLQRVGQELDLQNSITFDPIQHQIDALTSGMKEMGAPDLIAAIGAAQAAVDSAQASHDAIQASYDAENAKLKMLKDGYDALNQAVTDATNAMGDLDQMATSASQSAGNVGTGLQNFQDAAGGNFADLGGNATIGKEAGDLDKYIADLQSRAKDSFAKLNPFSTMKDKLASAFKEAIDFLPQPVQDFVTSMKSDLTKTIAGAGIGLVIGALIGGPMGAVIGAGLGASIAHGLKTENIKTALDALKGPLEETGNFFKPIGDFAVTAFEAIGSALDIVKPDIMRVANQILPELKKAWRDLAPAVVGFGKALLNLGKAVMPIVVALAKVIGVVLAAAFFVIVSVWSHTWKPMWDLIIDTVTYAIKIITDVINIFADILRGDFSGALRAVGQLFADVFLGMWHIIVDIAGIIWGVVRGIVEGIVHFFQWLYDVLVGHSIIPDLVDAIVLIWQGIIFLPLWIWNNILLPIINFFTSIWEGYIHPAMQLLWDGLQAVWNGIGAGLKWVWDNIIQPVWNLFVGIWNVVGGAIGTLPALFRTAWDGIGNGLRWVWDHTIQPVWDLFKGIWSTLKGGLQSLVNGIYSVANALGSGITLGANTAIGAVNALIGAINWIGSHGPISFHIGTVGTFEWTYWNPPQLAAGGEVGSGYKTNGIRAIVGEGNPSYPEYVIPTDPRYRGNAMRLSKSLMHQLGVPGFLLGGIPSPGDLVKGAVNLGGDVLGAVGSGFGELGGWAWDGAKWTMDKGRKAAVIAAFAGPLKAADALIGQIPDNIGIKQLANGFKNGIYNWAKGDSSGWNEFAGGGTLGSVPALADGAYIKRRSGGIIARLGEGSTDEVVAKVVSGSVYGKQEGTGDHSTHYHFEGATLEFPNVKDGDDVKDFIDGLKNMAA